jgi:hypothetical protein
VAAGRSPNHGAVGAVGRLQGESGEEREPEHHAGRPPRAATAAASGPAAKRAQRQVAGRQQGPLRQPPPDVASRAPARERRPCVVGRLRLNASTPREPQASPAGSTGRPVPVALSSVLMADDSSVGRLAARLRELAAGSLPGAQLPSGRELTAEHSVSPVTVSRAVARLVAEGSWSPRQVGAPSSHRPDRRADATWTPDGRPSRSAKPPSTVGTSRRCCSRQVPRCCCCQPATRRPSCSRWPP